ncbi:MAG TPA: amidohydrolase family protein [Acetobacteraceae bacterium]|nr:amidohydrolase family protein [Acetobacteraceae bacterium]
MIRVDAHHHVWQIARGEYSWLTPDLPIHRDYTLDDLRPLLGDVNATVLVQAAATEAETHFILEVADKSAGLVRGVVGWTDFASPGAPARMGALARNPLLKGMRPMLQDIGETDWILRRECQPSIEALVAAGLRFDALIQPRHLPVLLRLCGRHPSLRLVIDHGAKPAIARGAWQPWADDLARVASETSAFCKLSGLASEASAEWQPDDLRRYADHIIVCFGSNRVMWGSDWPVVELAGGYTRWRDTTFSLLKQLSAAEQDAILGGTANEFYGLAPL